MKIGDDRAILGEDFFKLSLGIPIDDVAAEAAFIYMMNSTNVVNLTTFNKTDQPRWIDSHQADAQFPNGGASIFDFASDEDPDYIFVGCGDIVSTEAPTCTCGEKVDGWDVITPSNLA